jgi:hypothetical protein
MACNSNRQSTLELHQSQSLLVLHLYMPSQLVAVVVVLMDKVVVEAQVVLRGVGLLLTQLVLLALVAVVVLLVITHAMETSLLAVAHLVVQVQLVVQEL